MLKAILVPLAFAYKESLDFEQFQDGKLLLHFKFVQSKAAELPRMLKEVIDEFQVNDLSLRVTKGRWRYDRWGYDPVASPAGVVMWSTFANQSASFDRWTGLTNALSGLFCASIHFMTPEITTIPRFVFDNVWYASLPRETVCTENLTPWLKLLPCQHRSGLGQLIHPHDVLDGEYQSMTLEWSKKCSTCDYELQLQLLVVVDPTRIMSTVNWSIVTLFGKFEHLCPLADATTVSVKLPQEGYELLSTPTTHSARKAVYHLNETKNIGVHWPNFKMDNSNPQRSPIAVHRYLKGSGQERGALIVEFRNNESKNVTVKYLESIPWILKLFLHTLRVENGAVKNMVYEPAIDRERPTLLELELQLGPGITTLSIDHEFSFVKLSEHHPDANYGFEIGYI